VKVIADTHLYLVIANVGFRGVPDPGVARRPVATRGIAIEPELVVYCIVFRIVSICDPFDPGPQLLRARQIRR